MIPSKPTDVFDPAGRSLRRFLPGTPEDVGGSSHSLPVGGIGENRQDVRQELIGGKVIEVHCHSIALVLDTLGVVVLVRVEWKSNHWNLKFMAIENLL